MKAILKRPSTVELGELFKRKVALLKRGVNIDTVRDARQLLKEMEDFRTEYPEHAGSLMNWEVELLDGFPGIEEQQRDRALTV
ncbi:MAG: hypothetical protein A3C88_01680 [Candidatus Yanofskybacteria bacterium RIFCSPHIGHO2_02_FULL_50_12]|uniref:Uncharacterized protein n=1 Tax=Candidatus Yanofskybacteria bacterium RIFCSPHIGHO2_02_FULL_50_12 TaxID=1802685 RepID=A0A1F8FUB0_9BACT|nr:MAG: hypothetical protein A3C88_01680 [Candidatus Yanofskybacteria bacterium RIFCSPHIGHO2_02_FULL_50_12]